VEALKKIAVVYQHLPHYRREIFARLDQSADLEVTFFADAMARGGIETISQSDLSDCVTIKNMWVKDWLWQRGLLKRALLGDYDYVIALGDPHYVTTWLLAIGCRLTGRPILFWTHGWTHDEPPVRRKVRNAFLRLADHLLLYSDYAKGVGRSEGFSEDKMTVIYNSVSPDGESEEGVTLRAIESIRSFRSSAAGPIVGAVARLRDEKQLDLLIEAVAVLRERGGLGRETSVLLAGEGPAKGDLAYQAEKLGVPIHFAGAIYGSEALEEFYNALDVTVVPDKLGLTGIQSLTHGTPVVTHSDMARQMPEAEAVVPGVNGQLFNRGDAVDLAGAIEDQFRLNKIDGRAVKSACKAEIEKRWNAQEQYKRIVTALGMVKS